MHSDQQAYDPAVGAQRAGTLEGALPQKDKPIWGETKSPSPLESAEALIKADQAHRSLAADQALLLKMVAPFAGTALKQLASGISQWNEHQGFWPTDEFRTTSAEKSSKIALLHSEVSELLEAVRKGDWRNEEEELADIFIRLLDYCGHYKVDLMQAVVTKQLHNYSRPYKHGKAF